jgi:hypothetical protein
MKFVKTAVPAIPSMATVILHVGEGLARYGEHNLQKARDEMSWWAGALNTESNHREMMLFPEQLRSERETLNAILKYLPKSLHNSASVFTVMTRNSRVAEKLIEVLVRAGVGNSLRVVCHTMDGDAYRGWVDDAGRYCSHQDFEVGPMFDEERVRLFTGQVEFAMLEPS